MPGRSRKSLRHVAAATAVGLMTTLAFAPAPAAELGFSVMESGTYDKAAQEIADTFKAKTGTSVKIAAFPWAVLRQNNTTDLISGTAQYDVMSGGYYLADVYPYFAPLSSFIKADDYSKGMIPGLMQPGRSEWVGDEQIGVPYGVDAFGLLVNIEILGKAGVKPDFKDWAEVAKACEAIESKNPGVACFSHSTGNPEQIGAYFFSAYAGTYITKDGKYALEADKAAAAASQITALWKHLPKNGTALSFDEAHQLFKDGKVAMTMTWPSFITGTLDKDGSSVKGKWTMVRFPGEGFPWLSLWQLFMPKTAKDPKTAWAWMKAFAGPENAKSNYANHNIGSVWLSVYDDPELKAKNAHFWPVMIEGYSRAKNPPLSGEAQDALTNTLQDIANGRVAAADGIKAVNEKWAGLAVSPALIISAKGSGLQAR